MNWDIKRIADRLAQESVNLRRMAIDFDDPIIVLALDVRTDKLLKAMGVKTVRDLVAKAAGELLGVKGFSERSLSDVESRLEHYGLRLAALAERGQG
jgi:DNA-directed RNA polymerase alpha subunit